MKAFRPAYTAAAALFLSALPMAAFAEKGYYRQDFSQPVPGFDTYVMQRYDGNTKDSTWAADTYKHTGPFTFSQGAGGLAIATKGYWEWDYCVIVLPSPIRVQPEDSLVMEVRVAPGSEHDSAMVGLQMGLSEKQSEDGVLYPSPQPVLVKEDWVKVAIGQKYGDDLVTHLFINIDAGYTTGPLSGWFTEPNKPFSGTIEVKSITLDGSAPAGDGAKAIPSAHAPVRVDGASIRYVGGNADNLITVYDMAGRIVGSARNAFGFKGNLKNGLYHYRISGGKRDLARGTFSLLE
jgi:hypothetical protein